MIKRLLTFILQLIASLGPIRLILTFIYKRAIKKLNIRFKDDKRIKDIYLTSRIESHDFVLGHSDINLLVIVQENVHPKSVLKDVRKYLKSSWDLTLVFNRKYLPILSTTEFNSETIRSFLIRNSYHEDINWNSLFNKDHNKQEIKDQDKFTILFHALQSLDYYLFKMQTKHVETRKEVKNIYRAMMAISSKNYHHLFNITLTKSWKNAALWLQRYRYLFFARSLFFNKTWKSLLKQEKEKKVVQIREINFDHQAQNYLFELVHKDWIDEISCTPSLIQNSKSSIEGKLFIEIHINRKAIQHLSEFDKITNRMTKFDNSKLKFKMRFIPSDIYRLQNEKSLYPFPLDSLYRKNKTFYLINSDYQVNLSKDFIIKSSIHFLVAQFMRFRSLEQKTDLIGSKFRKSLNLMIRYHLLLSYLKNNDLNFTITEKSARALLSPQFSEIKFNDVVNDEDWNLIKAQLIYLLKGIRDELIKYDESLKTLRF